MSMTTGQVAKACSCSPKLVAKWIDTGLLKGYKLPGSQDRRVERADLEAFAEKHGMALQEESEPEDRYYWGVVYADDGSSVELEDSREAADLMSRKYTNAKVIRLKEV